MKNLWIKLKKANYKIYIAKISCAKGAAKYFSPLLYPFRKVCGPYKYNRATECPRPMQFWPGTYQPPCPRTRKEGWALGFTWLKFITMNDWFLHDVFNPIFFFEKIPLRKNYNFFCYHKTRIFIEKNENASGPAARK